MIVKKTNKQYKNIFLITTKRMTQFLERTNQTLLWEMIHRHEHLNNVFETEQQKQEWFKHNISKRYDVLNREQTPISREQLSSINKEVLSNMWVEIQNLYTEQKTRTNTHMNSQTQPQTQQQPHTNGLESTYSRSSPKQDSYNTNFENRQQEYNNLFQRPVPTDVDFTEKTHDDAITNMDELIEQAKRERQQEYTQYSPPAPSLNISEDISENLVAETLMAETLMAETLMVEEEPTVSKVNFSIDPPREFVDVGIFNKYVLETNERIDKLSQRIELLETIVKSGSQTNEQDGDMKNN